MIRLVRPRIEHKKEALSFRQEFFDNGESVINGSELLDTIDSYEEWLESVTKNTSPETVARDWVVCDTYFAVDEGEKIVGIIDLRHELIGILENFGHTGYSVRPSERRKGYAGEMFSRIIFLAGKLGMKRLQLSVERENTPSIRIIKNAGGKYERSFVFQGEDADVYLIDIEENVKNAALLYVHGKGGSAGEAKHYETLFPDRYVFGLDYRTDSPWETSKEIEKAVSYLNRNFDDIILIANSIGAFYSMNADICKMIEKAYFISPMVDLVKLIADMMTCAKVSEEDLKREKIIKTDFGEDLSWDYLCYVREHPINWTVPTSILYGSEDHLVSKDTMKAFAEKIQADLTVMTGGEHWFHTKEQMAFLDNWIAQGRGGSK